MKQLNSLISTIKSKLKRGKPEDDEEEYEDEEEDEGTDVGEETEASEVTSKKAAKPKAKSKSKDEDEEDEEEEEEDDEDEEGESDDEAKKKKRVKIMGAIFAVVLLYVVADEMFLKTEVEDTAVPEVTGGFKRPPKRDRTKTKAKATPATESAIAAAKEATPTPAPTEEKLDIPTIDEASDESKEATAATPTPAIVQEEVAESNPFLESPTTTPSVGESVPTELEVPDRSEENLPVAEAAKIDEMIAGEVKKEYVAPPKYDQIGRGLVYNCGGKHWACVDKPAYFQCKDNYLHNKSEQKTIECYPSEVYATYDDCKTVQIHHINMVKEIDFCTAN